MNAITIITTPGGEKMAVLPLADYERLLEAAEDLADVVAYDRAKLQLAMGAEEMVPANFAKRLIAGEHPVRVWREFRGMSGKTLALQAGISAGYLSQIEKGERDGPFNLMQRLAQALDVSLDDLAA